MLRLLINFFSLALAVPHSLAMAEATSSSSSSSASSSFPLSLAPMWGDQFPLHHLFNRCARAGAEISTAFETARRSLLRFRPLQPRFPLFAALSQRTAEFPEASGRHLFDLALAPEYVAKTLSGTRVFTVSNSNNEFVLISDPNNSVKSLGLLCFRQEDARSLLAQVYGWCFL